MQFRLAKLWSDIHNGSVIVVFLSSTINPFIYGLWGRQFRAGIKSAFLDCVGSASRNRLATGHGIGGLQRDQFSRNVGTEDNNYNITSSQV